MDVLPTRVNRSDEKFVERVAHNDGLLRILREKLEKVKKGGGEKYVERHRNRGKALARERIQSICDPSAVSSVFCLQLTIGQ